ncbi:MAG: hypothetical protein ACM3UU_00725 [Ignavibacteriales bacterium]
MALTSKELMLLQDNIKMMESSINFMSGSSAICSDPQIKTMLDKITKDYSNNLHTLAKYISNPNIQ